MEVLLDRLNPYRSSRAGHQWPQVVRHRGAVSGQSFQAPRLNVGFKDEAQNLVVPHNVETTTG